MVSRKKLQSCKVLYWLLYNTNFWHRSKSWHFILLNVASTCLTYLPLLKATSMVSFGSSRLGIEPSKEQHVASGRSTLSSQARSSLTSTYSNGSVDYPQAAILSMRRFLPLAVSQYSFSQSSSGSHPLCRRDLFQRRGRRKDVVDWFRLRIHGQSMSRQLLTLKGQAVDEEGVIGGWAKREQGPGAISGESM